MKKYLLLTALGIVLTGCGDRAGGDWGNDCETYYSETGRELSKCIAKVEEHRKRAIESGVNIDPKNTERESLSEAGKGKGRHGSELNPAEK